MALSGRLWGTSACRVESTVRELDLQDLAQRGVDPARQASRIIWTMRRRETRWPTAAGTRRRCPGWQAPPRGAAVVQLNVHGHRKIIPKARSQVHEPVIGLWWPGSYRGKGACWRLVCTSMLVTLPGC